MIGLDTGHLVYNYGTKLQAYAMQTLLEQNGERCEIIQWHKRNFGIFNRVVDQYKVLKKIYVGFGKRMKYWPKVMERYKKFDDFNSKFHIHKYYGDLDEMKECVSKYSHVFCGSDQAWLPSNVEKHWYTLEFCNSNQVRAAYAPSFGVDRIEDSKLNAYKQFLSLFDYLSVREISGQKIIKKILEKDVPVVLDPTLLLERNYWDRLLKEATVCIPKQPYCFCYFLGNNKKHRESVKHLSQHKDYKIVNLQHFSGFCEADVDFADENLYAVSPQDFIALIANADYVCTDSFHCTAYITKNTLIAAGLNVILNFILIPKYGYVAAAYTTLASYFVAFILHSRYAKKIEPDIYPLKMFALPLLHVGGAIILYYPLLNFWTLRWGILFVYLIIVLIKERFRLEH